MKKLGYIFLVLLTLVYVACETDDVVDEKINNEEEREERITYVKSASYSYESVQQDFELFFAVFENDSTLTILLNYKSNASNNFHDFDFVWDEKLEVLDGKSLMNINVYHKTFVADTSFAVVDTVRLTVPDVLRESPNWFRLQNTTKTENKVTLEYNGWGSGDS